MMQQGGPAHLQLDQHVNTFPFYGHDPSEIIPREGCLLGCTFFIADYPSIVSGTLISAWVRVIREHGGQVVIDAKLRQAKPQPKALEGDKKVEENNENKSPNKSSKDASTDEAEK